MWKRELPLWGFQDKGINVCFNISGLLCSTTLDREVAFWADKNAEIVPGHWFEDKTEELSPENKDAYMGKLPQKGAEAIEVGRAYDRYKLYVTTIDNTRNYLP